MIAPRCTQAAWPTPGKRPLADSPADLDLLNVACTPIDADAHPAMIAYFNDRGVRSQLDWLDGLLPNTFAGRISESYIAPVANRYFRILVVCGNDPKRLIKLLRCYRNLVGRKLCIAMTQRSLPADRGKLLNAGFDDVFDLRMSHIEANCRLNAHLRRLDKAALVGTGECSGSATRYDPVVDQLANRRLSERERLVLGVLHLRLDQLTPLPDIHRAIRKRYGHSRDRSLHVVISLLRQKLRQDYRIVYHGEGGYVLASLGRDGTGSDEIQTAGGQNRRRDTADQPAPEKFGR